jgi:hypothetical protein
MHFIEKHSFKIYCAVVATCLIFYFIYRTPETVLIDCSPLANLDDFSDPNLKRALFRYLAASKSWRLMEEGDVPTAQFKEHWGNEPSIIASGDNHLQLYIHFGPFVSETRIRLSSFAIAGKPDQSIHLEPSPDASKTLGSAVFIKSPGVWLQILESNVKPERELTAASIKEVSKLLDKVKQNKAKILAGDYHEILPKGSSSFSDKDTLIIKPSGELGIYAVSGFVNPGEEGYITLEVHRVGSAESLIHPAHEVTEYVAFSSNPNLRFSYELEVQIDVGEVNGKYPTQFEIWFHPRGGGGTRKLVEQSREINVYGSRRGR